MLRYIYVIITLLLSTRIAADYDCLCNYAVELTVLQSPKAASQTLGYMYEFDCKPTAPSNGQENNFYAIQYEKQLGYIPAGAKSNAQLQTCPGELPISDLIPVTTQHQHVVTTHPATTVASFTTVKTFPTTTQKTTVATAEHTTSILLITSHVPKTTMPTTQTARTTSAPATTKTSSTPMTSTITTAKTTTTTTTPTPTTPRPQPTTTTPTTTPQTTKTTSTMKTTTTPPTTTRTTTTTPQPTTLMTTTPVSLLAVNVSGTRLEYIGVGYNLLEGNPDGRGGPGSGVTTGALPARRILQLSVIGRDTATEVEYRDKGTCTHSTHTNLVGNGKSYQNELLQYVVPTSSHPHELVTAAFVYSKEMMGVRQVTENLQSDILYRDISSTCSLGTLRYKDELTGMGNFTITQEFAVDVCNLIQTTNGMPQFWKFLDKWGTSIVTEVDMGTRTVSRYQMRPLQIFQQLEQTDPQLIQHAGSFEGFASSLSINSTLYPSSKSAQGTVGSLYDTIHDGSPSLPVPIKITIVPITAALDFKYWKHIMSQLTVERVCSDNVDARALQNVAGELTQALKQYAEYKHSMPAFQHVTAIKDTLLQIPVTWPVGTYGLMEAATGCPASQVTWLQGWRKQDTEDGDSHNQFTPGIENFMAGSFSNDIVTKFCMKRTASTTKFDQAWPKGTYCLLKFGECPNGFGSGYIYWDDEDVHNADGSGGTLPDGTYNSNTKIYYCCRNDGSPSTSINLPTDKPFILVRNYGGVCQSVYGMNVQDVFVKWDDEDTFFNSDEWGGSHPLDEGGSENHLLHFCHYERKSTEIVPGIIG